MGPWAEMKFFHCILSPGKKITKGIATNPVTEPFTLSVSIPCMPRRKFSRMILKFWSRNILHIVWSQSKGSTLVKGNWGNTSGVLVS